MYNLKLNDLDGNPIQMSDYKDKVLLIVNTASKCGFTPQYEDLQRLHDKYSSQGLEIIGFPCNQFKEQESGSANEIKDFCQLNYGVNFLITEKVDVRGPQAHPVFDYLTERAPFEGFDTTNAMGKILHQITEAEYPEFLEDNSVKWNFTKFLVSKDGKQISRFEPIVAPLDMESAIEKLLND